LWRPGAHPCKQAFDALKEAGHSPDVVKVEDGEVIKDSKKVVAWARGNREV
jgi:hypothetical protein